MCSIDATRVRPFLQGLDQPVRCQARSLYDPAFFPTCMKHQFALLLVDDKPIDPDAPVLCDEK
jgi:hypothetical protein